MPVLGGFQMLLRFSIRFPTMRTDWRFSMWEPTDTFKCDNRTANRPQVLTWSRTGYKNRFKCIHVYFFGEPDRFSHWTQIRFLEFCVSFIASSCASSHLQLLLFSCCYYFVSHTAITLLFITIILFSHCFFLIAFILFVLLLLFSHYVAFLVWWSN
jgi:hypothetical protein